MVLRPFDAVKLIKQLKLIRHSEGQQGDAMLVRFVLEQINDGIARVFLFVIPMDNPWEIGASQIGDEQDPEQNAAEPRAFAGKNSGENENAKPDCQRKK